MIDLTVLLVTTFVSGFLGLVVLLRDTHNVTNRLFGLFTMMAILWGVANYSTNHVRGYESLLFANRLSLFVGFLLIQSVWLLSIYFPKKVSNHTIQRRVSVLATVGLFALTLFTDKIVSSVVYVPSKKITDITIGELYFLYVLAAAVFFIFLIYNFRTTYKSKEINSLQRQQIVYASTGLLLTFIWAMLTAAVIPTITNNWEISKFGTVGTLFMVGFVSFSIIRLKLFDIKLIFVRSFVYTITTTFLVAIYSAISLPVKNFLISVNTDSYISTLAEIILLGIFGISFYPLKLYFDRVTTKYFFRDHYNVQEVLKNINAILSVSVDLDKMLHRVGGIIKNTLLIEHCAFIIDEDQITGQIRYINVGKSVSRVSLPQGVDKLFRGRNVVIVDQLKEEGVEQELKKYLVFQSIAVLVKLRGVEEHGRVENQGYIVLGNKKSGKSFSGQDEKMLDILSAQLAVAAQNLVHIDEIVHFNIKLQDEITDATKELKVKNKKLRELDQTKDEFVSMASHQLRTPLTAIKGYLSMVIEGDAGDLKPGQKQLLDQAYMSTQRMVYLIADLLNLSRLKTGKFVITPQPTSLAGMIEGEIHQIQETAKSRGHKVSFMCDPSIPDLMLDDMKTRQVIMNFIDNAIYYTPAGGNIQVFLEQKDGKVIFKVTDNGIGVAKALGVIQHGNHLRR